MVAHRSIHAWAVWLATVSRARDVIAWLALTGPSLYSSLGLCSRLQTHTDVGKLQCFRGSQGMGIMGGLYQVIESDISGSKTLSNVATSLQTHEEEVCGVLN